MRYLYRRGKGARRRVMHLGGYDPMTGHPRLEPFCGSDVGVNTSINVPLGGKVCKRCLRAAAKASS